MEYTIEKWEAMDLLMHAKDFHAETSETEIPKFWDEYYAHEETRYKAADYLAPKERPFKANERHELIVKTEVMKGHRRMVVTCGDVTFAYVDDRLPERFRAGIIGCEGRNWFYDFKVRTRGGARH